MYLGSVTNLGKESGSKDVVYDEEIGLEPSGGAICKVRVHIEKGRSLLDKGSSS